MQKIIYVGKDGKLAWSWMCDQVRGGFFRSISQAVITAIIEMRERREKPGPKDRWHGEGRP